MWSTMAVRDSSVYALQLVMKLVGYVARQVLSF